MWGIATGLAYIYMAATWGGYVFVLNMIGIHCGILVCFGRFSKELHRAYTLFYFIGTLGAIQVPVIGYTPIKSLEQLPCAAVFVGMQLLELCRYLRENKPDMDNKTYRLLQAKVFGVAACAALAVIMTLAPTGYFGPISSRIRSLFVAHTRTGNPLVDSVAEHQPASPQAYWQYLYLMCYIAPIGFAISVYKGFVEASNASLFLTSYGLVAYYFSLKMARLIVLIGPVASALSGMAFGLGIEWAIEQLLNENVDDEVEEAPAPSKKEVKETASKELKGKPGKRKKQPKQPMKIDNPFKPLVKIYRSDTGKTARKVIAVAITVLPAYYSLDFYQYSQRLAEAMSNPSIMFQGTLQNGETVMVDDYREAYWWLKENTPPDSRVMAWWDYGYQIAGIANRTTIADGNTWNHEHIATLGKCLVSPEKEAHQMVRHLADYVLLWTGGGGDDLAKSPHMARISNSVYEGICGGDPTCRTFGFTDNQMTPTPMMEASLLYRLHSSGTKGKMHDTNLFDDVFSSKFRKVRIFKVKSIDKKSKAWVANPANRICDAPGSWYCSGQYPPKFRKFIDKKKDFAQLEDFNKKGDAKSKKYNEEYMKRMGGH
jgi:dolichyl-diphosphooligosaccharide--protein glycosyltransferase